MAVTGSGSPRAEDKPRQRIADYYPRLRRRVIAFAVVMQIVIMIILAALLISQSEFSLAEILIYVILPATVLQVFMSYIILKYVLSPLSILARAIAHVSNETNDVTPPNVNATYYERTGIKGMVDTVYSLALKDSEGADKPEKLVTSLEMTNAILGAFPCGIIALDEKRNVIYANDRAPVLQDSKGEKSIKLLFQGDDTLDSWLTNNENNSLAGEHIWSRIQTALPDEPNRKLCDIIATYRKNGTQGIDTLIVTVDRTAHYASDEEDMDFIALAAHELRGPITVIRGYLDVLSDELHDQLQPDQVELFKRLSVSASRLSGYVSNILNVSRYDRRHLKLNLREDQLGAVYATIADDLSLRASTQGRLLSVIIPENLPTIAADRNSLSEVLANLVDNAIKYSNEGGSVEVTAAQDGNFVTVSVTDHGIGIPSSVVGHLFSKFYRSHRSRQNVTGTGLGLYISKAVIESHGGKIGVSSSEGHGSTFRFSVPTYSSVADKLKTSNNGNEGVMETTNGWIKNHSMFGG